MIAYQEMNVKNFLRQNFSKTSRKNLMSFFVFVSKILFFPDEKSEFPPFADI